ncbi:hypothetical protein BGX33_008509 [Mortierella sp. NVP41]|nr:hypothetical protein BGX33_008509 [Mortierella sp. NVP41]
MEVHPFDSAPAQETQPYHQPFQATVCPNTDEKPSSPTRTRRRHSVFSDFSIENCPLLLAMQQRQQQQREEQEQLDGHYQALSASQMSLTRSKTETSLRQNYDSPEKKRHTTTANHYRHDSQSTVHSTPSATTPIERRMERPRRNTVILGKNLIRSTTTPIRRPNPNAKTTPFKSTSHQATTTDAYTASIQRRQEEVQQQQWRQPAGRPESSHSYKHDFLKETARWKPHPWTAASSSYSHSSACSSPSSPLHQSRFPHELVDDDDEEEDGEGDTSSSDSSDDDDDSEHEDEDEGEDECEGQGEMYGQEGNNKSNRTQHQQHQEYDHRPYFQEQEQGQSQNRRRSFDSNDTRSHRSLPTRRPKAGPLYHDIKAIQMRPYGHEDDDYEEEMGNDRHGYEGLEPQQQLQGQDGWGLQGEQGYESGYYDTSSQWQCQGDDSNHYYDHHDDSAYDEPSSSASASCGYRTPKTRSQGSLAKAKFYEYLKSSSASSSSSFSSPCGSNNALDDGHKSHDLNQATAGGGVVEHDYYEGEDGSSSSSLHHQFGSGYSFTSSLRAHVRLTRTKTVLRQVKRWLSEALSEATTKAKAATSAPLGSNNGSSGNANSSSSVGDLKMGAAVSAVGGVGSTTLHQGQGRRQQITQPSM